MRLLNLELAYSCRLIFIKILLEAMSTRGPGTFLEISFKIGIAFNRFVSFNLYFRVFAFFLLNYPNFFVILVYM